MWIFTRFGFLSAVNHRDKKGTLLVRAREPGVLEMLCERGGIKSAVRKTNAADYLYRMEFPKKTFAKLIAAETEAIDYPNFKNAARAAIPANESMFHTTLMDVWCLMNRYQHEIEGDRKLGVTQSVMSEAEDLGYTFFDEDWITAPEVHKDDVRGSRKAKGKAKNKTRAMRKKKGKGRK